MTKIPNWQERIFRLRDVAAISGSHSFLGLGASAQPRMGQGPGANGQGMSGAGGHKAIVWGSKAWSQVLDVHQYHLCTP